MSRPSRSLRSLITLFLALWLGLVLPSVSFADRMTHDKETTAHWHESGSVANAAHLDGGHDDFRMSGCDRHHCHGSACHSCALPPSSHSEAHLLIGRHPLLPALSNTRLQSFPSRLDRPPRA